jgi:hypothetical protein
MQWRHLGTEDVQLHSFLISALDRREWSPAHLGRFSPRKNPGSIDQGAGWASESVWTFRKRVQSLAPAGIRTPDRPARGLVTIPTAYGPGQRTYLGSSESVTLPKQFYTLATYLPLY